MVKSRNLVFDVAPLWEEQFTGISNVVCELAARALRDKRPGMEIKFSAFDRILDRSVIEQCVEERRGTAMREAMKSNKVRFLKDDKSIDMKRDVGFYLHIKPATRRYHKEAHLYYDFSFLSVPETHAADTVDFHLKDLADQIESTDLFFTISESTALDLKFYFNVPDAKITVAYPAHNADAKAANDFLVRIHGREVESYILVLGTIEPRKNVDLILAWLKQHPSILASFRVVFCGRDGWGPPFAETLSAHGLDEFMENGRIAHFGYVGEAVKSALISSASAIIYPSLFEGFGLPVLEAMAIGVPVIASCSTSIPEVMGPDGYYFDPYSIESLNGVFHDFVSDRRSGILSERLSKLRHRSNQFSYDQMFETILNKIMNSLN